MRFAIVTRQPFDPSIAVSAVPDERVGRVSGDAGDSGGLDPDPVAQVDALVDGQELVLAVLAQRADDEGEVDLRRRRPDHRSASASATNSPGAKRLGAHVCIAPDRRERLDGPVAQLDAREGERVGQRLAAMCERGVDQPAHVSAGSGTDPAQRDER